MVSAPSPLVPCAPGFPCARPHRRRRVERCAKCDAFFQRIGLVPEGQTLRDCCKRAMGYTDDGWSRRQVAVGAATSAALATGAYVAFERCGGAAAAGMGPRFGGGGAVAAAAPLG